MGKRGNIQHSTFNFQLPAAHLGSKRKRCQPSRLAGPATAVHDAGANGDGGRTARSVLECASPLALWAGTEFGSTSGSGAKTTESSHDERIISRNSISQGRLVFAFTDDSAFRRTYFHSRQLRPDSLEMLRGSLCCHNFNYNSNPLVFQIFAEQKNCVVRVNDNPNLLHLDRVGNFPILLKRQKSADGFRQPRFGICLSVFMSGPGLVKPASGTMPASLPP